MLFGVSTASEGLRAAERRRRRVLAFSGNSRVGKQNTPLYVEMLVNTMCLRVALCLRFTINTLRTGDADLRFYITTVQDG